MTNNGSVPSGIIVNIVKQFLSSHLSLIFIILSLCLGVAAILVTPREEEPQIIVPLADIFVNAPGATPAEVEKLAATPLERLLWQIDGVEYVYSMSNQDNAIVTVRFFVGEDREKSLVKLYNKININIDRVPAIVKGWVIKPVEIDDVPIVGLTLYSKRYNDHELRRIGEEVLARLAEVKNVSRTEIIGGRKREIRVELQPEQMAAHNISILGIERTLAGADKSVTAGSFSRFNRQLTITSNSFLTSAEQVASLVVGVNDGRPVYLRDVAEVIDGPEEPLSYTKIRFSDNYCQKSGTDTFESSCPAVTLALAKKKGTNAVRVADDVLAKLADLKKTIIPDDVNIEITRNYGNTAQQKVSSLLYSLAFAIISVVILLAVVLGWREALVVALAVPISFSLALFVNYMFGYTINRVTLFALILSLGLVVDDPITNVDNIQRHIFLGRHNPFHATLAAVHEVLPPVIMSTIAIIICFTPLFFITGMMGPYMKPMATSVPLTVIFSTLCAITIVPWFSHLLLRNTVRPAGKNGTNGTSGRKESSITVVYRKSIDLFLVSRPKRYALFAVILVLLVLSAGLAFFKLVPLKLLPFDNKDEFQLVIDLPEGTTLETTDMVTRAFEDYLRNVPEITSMVSYVGVSSPMDFNGLVRHYYLRQGPHLADIRINLADKSMRDFKSHAITLRVRKDLEDIARQHNADIKIVEVPPGPPVLSTIVAEVYGPPDMPYSELLASAEQVKDIMMSEPFVVDVDVMAEADHDKVDFLLDKEKAALHGVSTENLIRSLQAAVGGSTPATVHLPGERQPLNVKIILPREKRSGIVDILQIPLMTAAGRMIPMAEIVDVNQTIAPQPIFHKNLSRVVYVLGETAGRPPAEAVLSMQKRLKKEPPSDGVGINWSGEGEWKITLSVFRDMGIAFGAALIGIYILLVIQANSFFMPMLIMMAIPLTILGIMPGFWLLNIITSRPVGGFENPVFFTATSMIGMIALGGIVIRNSLVLIEFIQEEIKKKTPLREAILQSGAIRMRPILLTAMTTAIGALPITLDPVFSGLAWALIFGLFASTAFTLLVVPVTYFAIYQNAESR
ncbi:MAG: efflux RND transporter permease subunit [Proteobacteria bacterium]|nr:efflux RND transporter permease subunit [Pseudomonadota bacterium]